MKQATIRRVLVIGAGTMGLEIAWQCASHGYGVVVYDAFAKALRDSERRLIDYSAELLAHGFISPDQTRNAFKHIAFVADPKNAAQGVDLINESITEDPKIKSKVFAQFNILCPPSLVKSFTSPTKPSSPRATSRRLKAAVQRSTRWKSA